MKKTKVTERTKPHRVSLIHSHSCGHQTDEDWITDIIITVREKKFDGSAPNGRRVMQQLKRAKPSFLKNAEWDNST